MYSFITGSTNLSCRVHLVCYLYPYYSYLCTFLPCHSSLLLQFIHVIYLFWGGGGGGGEGIFSCSLIRLQVLVSKLAMSDNSA